ncbi:uncharacterized protein G6M90_00g055330 [Metarhizium brunneum]|uniref:Uncharacterized protein n=1 Tax=Metarhizium brunneum TaxID=500148 RepID=A0A7D5UXB4_9HYPO
MKLSITLVTLLTGLTAGSPAKIDKRETDYGGEPLKEYCAIIGLEADTIKVTDEGIAATCRSDPAVPPKTLQSREDGAKFCEKLGMQFSTSGSLDTAMKSPQVWCKYADDGDSNATELIAKYADENGNVNQENLKDFLMGLSRDAPGTVTGLYNALKAAPSVTKSKFGLGGASGTAGGAATVAYDFIMANMKPGGLFGADTSFGRWLRTNPIYGASGTRSSPFDTTGNVMVYYKPNTKLCIPFKDESSVFWSTSVKRCKFWHDKKDCDTSYAYDAKTDIGKELRERCTNELDRNGLPEKEREEQMRREEAACIRPRWVCGSLGKRLGDPLNFQYCMDDSEAAKKACDLAGWTYRIGRMKTKAEEEQEREERLQKEESECFHPRQSCRNVYSKFLYCMRNDWEEKEKCRREDWRPTEQPTKSSECVKIKSHRVPGGPYYTAVCVPEGEGKA